MPDRLVDGGISGIFGRGLVEPRLPTGFDGDPALVVVDAGRSLRVDTGRSLLDRLLHNAERVSALYHLSRWLMVAFDVTLSC